LASSNHACIENELREMEEGAGFLPKT